MFLDARANSLNIGGSNMGSVMERTQDYFDGPSGHRLFRQSWSHQEADNAFKGTVLITHGISEHSEYYNRLAQGIKGFGWNVHAWDLLGHGRSAGKRGLVLDFMDFCRDLKKVYTDLRSQNDKPIVMLGHSMGGLITTRTLLEYSEIQPAAVCLSAPAFGLAMPVPLIKDLASRVIAKWIPRLTLGNGIHYGGLSKDPEMLSYYSNDKLRHNRVSAGVYLGTLEHSEFSMSEAKRLTFPLLMILPEKDPICSSPEGRRFFDKLTCKDNVLKIYKNSLHEVFNDLEREQAYQDLGEFLRRYE